MVAVLVPLLFLGCRPTVLGGDTADPGGHSGLPDTADTPDLPDDTSSPGETAGDTGVEHVPGDTSEPAGDDPAAALFTLDEVHEAGITLSTEAWRSLQADPYTPVQGDLTFDGEAFPGVGVRIKGRIGSFRDLNGKSGFKIDFNEYGATRELYGLEKINFNNMVQDSAWVHEVVAYRVFRELGVPAPRVGYVWVQVNGEPFGLYSLVEVYDDVFLDHHYADPSGNLYDGDYYLWDNGSYTLVDFERSIDKYFQLDEGTDVGLEDIHGITRLYFQSAYTADFWAESSKLIHWEEFWAMWAAEAWTGHYDSYSYNRNNYRVYFNPEDGLLDFFPWDPDWAFCADTPITSPTGLTTAYCKADDTCHQGFLDTLERSMETIDGLDLVADVDRAAILIQPYIDLDPRKETTASSIAWYQEELRRWIANRSDQIRATRGM